MFSNNLYADKARFISDKNKWKIDVEKSLILANVISCIRVAAKKGYSSTEINLNDNLRLYSSFVYSRLVELGYSVRTKRDSIYIRW